MLPKIINECSDNGAADNRIVFICIRNLGVRRDGRARSDPG
jgi:hypothetical protein